jgi:hypothetical protein
MNSFSGEYGAVTGCCERGNEHSGSMRDRGPLLAERLLASEGGLSAIKLVRQL